MHHDSTLKKTSGVRFLLRVRKNKSPGSDSENDSWHVPCGRRALIYLHARVAWYCTHLPHHGDQLQRWFRWSEHPHLTLTASTTEPGSRFCLGTRALEGAIRVDTAGAAALNTGGSRQNECALPGGTNNGGSISRTWRSW